MSKPQSTQAAAPAPDGQPFEYKYGLAGVARPTLDPGGVQDVYRFRDDVDDGQLITAIGIRIDGLHAVLFSITGQGYDSFMSTNEHLRHDLLQHCEIMTTELKVLYDKLLDVVSRE